MLATVYLDTPEKIATFTTWLEQWSNDITMMSPNLAGGSKDLEIYEIQGTLEAFAELPKDFFVWLIHLTLR